MSEYTPDRWVILEVDTGAEKFKRALSGWYGGYLDGNSWRFSSVIKEIVETKDGYTFTTESGSHYTLRNSCYGLSGLTASILNRIMKDAEGTQTKVRILEDYDPS